VRARGKQSWLTDATNGGASLLTDIAQAAAAAGTLHVCWLQCNNEIVAAHLGFTHQGTLYWYMPSYALSWARFGPGRLLLLKTIGWAIDNGFSSIDFMRGEEPYKARLSNDHDELSDFIFAGSPLARLTGRWLIPWYQRRQSGAASEQ
jgi:CelD/BcsL family acetyltransferase involved in cellulose biosynthesis